MRKDGPSVRETQLSRNTHRSRLLGCMAGGRRSTPSTTEAQSHTVLRPWSGHWGTWALNRWIPAGHKEMTPRPSRLEWPSCNFTLMCSKSRGQTFAQLHLRRNLSMCRRIHVHTHLHIKGHVHIHVHIHTQRLSRACVHLHFQVVRHAHTGSVM